MAAEEAAGLHAMRRIVASGHELALVLSSDVRRRSVAPGIIDTARGMGIAIEAASRVRDPEFGRRLRAAGIDVLLNVHSLYRIHASVLEAPTMGSFNLHPGILPDFAGLNTVSWAVYEGAMAFGSTLHWIDPVIDAGPIAYAARFTVDQDITAGRLLSRAVHEGLTLLDRLLSQLTVDPSVVPRNLQDLSRRRYFDRRIPNGGRVDWSTQSAAQIARFIRACDYGPFESPWGSARARIGDCEAELIRVIASDNLAAASPGTVMVDREGRVFVAAIDAWVELQQVRVGGHPVAPAELARSITPAVDAT